MEVPGRLNVAKADGCPRSRGRQGGAHEQVQRRGLYRGRREEPGRGRDAETPNEIPFAGLRDVFWRVFTQVIEDRVTLVAAGVAFYILLSLFPALGALVSLYGFIADPSSMAKHITFMADILPPGAFDIILTQLNVLVQAKPSSLTMAFFLGLMIALWSANSAVKAMFDAMNIAYGETEKRGIIQLNLISLAFTGIALIFAAILVAAIGGVPAVLSYLWLDRWQETLIASCGGPSFWSLSAVASR